MKKSRQSPAKTQKAKAASTKAVSDLPVKDATGVKGGRKAGGEQQDFVKITMSDVLVSSF